MLRKKTLLGVGAALAVLIILLYLISQEILLDGFLTLERQTATRNVGRVENILNDDRATLVSSIVDWAYWDETYDFMGGDNPEYIANNISEGMFAQFRINLVMYVSPSGEVAYSRSHDATDVNGAELVESVRKMLTPDSLLLADVRDETSFDKPPPGMSDILNTPQGPLLIAEAPILMNTSIGVSRGVLIWGRYLGVEEAERLSTLTSLPVRIIPLTGDPSQITDSLAGLNVSPDAPMFIQALDEDTVAGYCLVEDLNGAPAFVFEISAPREVFQRGKSTLTLLVIALIVTGVVISAVVLILIERLVLARLARLNRSVLQIAGAHDLSIRVPAEGDDELSNLGRAINTALGALARSQLDLTELNADLERRVIARTAELQARQHFLQTILDTMKEGVIFSSADEVYYANNVFLEMSGYTAGEVIGRPYRRLFDAPILKALERDGDDPTAMHRGEGRLCRRDDGRVDVSVTASAPVELDGQFGRIYIVRDVTEERILQARKDRFLANASHELRTPITNLMTRLYLLRKRPEPLEAHLAILDEVVMSMRALVEDLLDATRFNQGSTPLARAVVPLQTLIDSVVNLQRPEAEIKNLTLTTTLPAQPIYAHVDPKRIDQVLTNLIVNAIHYTNSGGHVEVILSMGEAGGYRQAVIMISDDGIGVSAENLPQMFQPFFRASQETPGTGLGLAIVKEIIDRHGGTITVESELGRGTVFTVTLAAEMPEGALVQPGDAAPDGQVDGAGSGAGSGLPVDSPFDAST